MSEYVSAFNYIDKILIVLNATTGGFFIFCSVSVVWIASAAFTVAFFLATGIVKKIIEYNKKQKEKMR